jgi:hypothetical protein
VGAAGALVDFLPMIGGTLAGIPTVLFAATHSLTAGIVTAAVFVGYQPLENRALNPVVMSRTVKVNPLLVFMSILIGSSIGDWFGGYFGAFMAATVLQIVVREIWRVTAPGCPLRAIRSTWSLRRRAAGGRREERAQPPGGRPAGRRPPRRRDADYRGEQRADPGRHRARRPGGGCVRRQHHADRPGEVGRQREAVTGLTGVRSIHDEIEIGYDVDPVD